MANPCVARNATLNALVMLKSTAKLEPGLLSDNLTQTFTPEQISQAVQQGLAKIGQITSIEPKGDLELSGNGEWLSGHFLITTSLTGQHAFLVVFHKENGQWKLFGTNEE